MLAISCYRPSGDNFFQKISKITISLSFSGFALISVTRRLILNIAYGECIARNVRIFAPIRNKLHFNQMCFNHFLKLCLLTVDSTLPVNSSTMVNRNFSS